MHWHWFKTNVLYFDYVSTLITNEPKHFHKYIYITCFMLCYVKQSSDFFSNNLYNDNNIYNNHSLDILQDEHASKYL